MDWRRGRVETEAHGGREESTTCMVVKGMEEVTWARRGKLEETTWGEGRVAGL